MIEKILSFEEKFYSSYEEVEDFESVFPFYRIVFSFDRDKKFNFAAVLITLFRQYNNLRDEMADFLNAYSLRVDKDVSELCINRINDLIKELDEIISYIGDLDVSPRNL